MVVLRCTVDLLKELGVKAQKNVAGPTAALGDWYAKPVSTVAGDFIVCMGEVTYLSILVPMILHRDLSTFFPMRLEQMLVELGVADREFQNELHHYQQVVFARTASRRTLGVLNEIAFGYQIYAERHPLSELAHLSQAQRVIASAIYGAPNYIQPDRATSELLGG